MRRDWTAAIAKVEGEGRCRACRKTVPELRRLGRRLEIAHTIGRGHDILVAKGVRLVPMCAVVGLCGPPTDTSTCHAQFDGHELDLWPLLTAAERKWAVDRIGEGQARRRISGRDWR